MVKNYGVPYKGSKNRIAKWIVDILPAANTLVDAFAGGCAITHAAIESEKFKRFVMNDINPRNAVVYCDPPYKCSLNTSDYFGSAREFNRESFLDWCADVSRTTPIFISEYSIDDPRFEVVAEKEKICSMNDSIVKKVCERLYTVKI